MVPGLDRSDNRGSSAFDFFTNQTPRPVCTPRTTTHTQRSRNDDQKGGESESARVSITIRSVPALRPRQARQMGGTHAAGTVVAVLVE